MSQQVFDRPERSFLAYLYHAINGSRTLSRLTRRRFQRFLMARYKFAGIRINSCHVCVCPEETWHVRCRAQLSRLVNCRLTVEQSTQVKSLDKLRQEQEPGLFDDRAMGSSSTARRNHLLMIAEKLKNRFLSLHRCSPPILKCQLLLVLLVL